MSDGDILQENPQLLKLVITLILEPVETSYKYKTQNESANYLTQYSVNCLITFRVEIFGKEGMKMCTDTNC